MPARHILVDETHGANIYVIADPEAASDNATVGADIHVVSNMDQGIALEVSADGSVLPNGEITTDDYVLENHDTLHMTKTKPNTNTGAQHDLDAMSTDQTVIDALGHGLESP